MTPNNGPLLIPVLTEPIWFEMGTAGVKPKAPRPPNSHFCAVESGASSSV